MTAKTAHHLLRLAGARQFGISGNGSYGVPRHINLRNDVDESLRSIFHHFAHLVLRVIATINVIVYASAPRSHVGEARIALNFDAPALIVAQMQMQFVDFERAEHIDVFFQSFNTNEMTAHVNHQSAVGKSRLVGNRNARGCPLHAFHHTRALHLRRQQLHERAHATKQAFGCACHHLHSIGLHTQPISFLSQTACSVNAQCNASAVGHRNGVSCGTLQFVGKELRHLLSLNVGATYGNTLLQLPISVFQLHAARLRNNAYAHIGDSSASLCRYGCLDKGCPRK